jgi:tetratricopeptide (TPR) repeat protein/DNA-binding SARP family transcriptional activator
MEFRLLGPVEIGAGGRVLDGGPAQHRLLLAALAVEAGRPVSVESLVGRVWDDPPEQPRRALQVYISRIRRTLDVPVSRRSGGYLLDIDPDRVDLHRFQRLVGEARGGDERQRVERLRQALELWRGQPLSDLPGHWAETVRRGWQQQYLETVVAWALASVRVGEPGAALPRLGALVGEHPLAESLSMAYMRALYAAGRPAEALEHYAMIRRRLADELGTEPGTELRALHRQILAAEPALVPPTPGPPAPHLVPRQLPAPPQLFTGRATELADLDRIVDMSTVVITAVDGMAGVGKTALAVQAAHRVAGHYPDGQLFIDLHGYTQGMEPIDPAEALDHALRALGIAGTQIPSGLDQRAALYRSRLANQKLLIVLDNAATEAQVTPLLPGSPGCLVLVTSRRRLTGLDHTLTLSLDTLPVPDAVTLFVQTAGPVDQPPDLLAELVELCGRLPLAIRIAAARLRSRPSWSLADLVERLRDRRHRLDELAAGQRSVTAALDLSYQDLSPGLQQTYRLLGLHPGPEIDAYATAALLDSTVLHARRMLDRLLDAHLLLEPVARRYRFHDLTRAHAASLESEPAAPDRLLDYYRHTAALAMDAAYPYERAHRPQVPPAHTPTPDLSRAPQAVEWLDTELTNLLAAANHAYEHDRPAHLLSLSTILHQHLHARSRYRDAEALHQRALTTARAIGDRYGELDALSCLGHIYRGQGRHEPATDHFGQALTIARATGHRPGELTALNSLGHIHRLQGRRGHATDHFGQALRIARATGHRPGELTALSGLGDLDWLHGRHEQATDHYQQALEIAREIGHRPGERSALTGLGWVRWQQGRYELAADHLGQALRIARATGHRPGELTALNSLGHIHRLQGRYEQGADHFEQALRLARATGHRNGQLNALNGLAAVHRQLGRHRSAADLYRQLLDLAQESGDRNLEFEARQGTGWLELATGDPKAAITHHEQALALAGELGQRGDQARAHDGLAHAHRALGEREHAREHWQHALDILTDLGVDHTEDEQTTVSAIRAHLASDR